MKQGISQSFRKGKETIKRKAVELSTLCDIPVGLMIVCPNGKTETWPESKTELKTIVDMYKEKTKSRGGGGGGGEKTHDFHQRDSDQNNNGNGLNSKIVAVDNRIGVSKKQKKNDDVPRRVAKYDDELMELLNSKIAAIEKRIEVLKSMEGEDRSS